MSEKPLLDLHDVGFDEESDEEITSVTYAAIVADEKRPTDKGSFIALFRYMHAMKRAHNRRLLRLERLAFACVVVFAFILTALEVWRSLKH